MSDPSDIGTAEEEKKTNDLLALLYPDEDAHVDATLYEGDEELAGMRSLRELFREAADENPSDAVSNKLLALAAQHAPVPKTESRGLWAWLSELMMPLVAHPGLAAAATLVLVAGVAGTLYVKGGAKVAEPTAQSRGERPGSGEPASSTQPSLTPANEESVPSAPGAEPAPVVPEPTNQAEVAEEERSNFKDERLAQPFAGDSAGTKAKRKPAESGVIGGLLGATLEGGGGGGAFGRADESQAVDVGADAPADDKSTFRGASGGSQRGLKVKDIDTRDLATPTSKPEASSASASKITPSQDPSASPPPPAEPKKPSPNKPSPNKESKNRQATTEIDADDDQAPAAKEQPAGKTQKGGGTQVATLHKQALAAAKKDDCAKVRSLGQQIRKLDSAYYDRSFLADPALKSCRSSNQKNSKSSQ